MSGRKKKKRKPSLSDCQITITTLIANLMYLIKPSWVDEK